MAPTDDEKPPQSIDGLSTTSESPQPPPGPSPETSNITNPGLSFWEQRRAAWVCGHKPYPEEEADKAKEAKEEHCDWASKSPVLSEVQPGHMDAIYKSMVEGRRFARPVPLPFVVAVLVDGWKKEGLWSPATGIGGVQAGYPLEEESRHPT
ncbi:uncharacterized protein EV422DRAFT_109460 [Fimicolochytrium jonesii]|uniref:uncharacterized protein n=1 Tax=Fimicolochytrium jonesii TaxID=1396493 RepID=UPI0022FDEB36|nr:uncharacterized protein EV422DRAFT_109460 [Fimicolochytrium jonesii]KAI8819365.1 hypothetical protein EV422DRAFT_109460 [Fimicolochytrium jonesii]